MKKTILLLTTILFLNIAYAEENKTPDFSKMTNEELIAHFMESKKRQKESFERLKKTKEELAKVKKLNKTLDKLNNMLGVEE